MISIKVTMVTMHFLARIHQIKTLQMAAIMEDLIFDHILAYLTFHWPQHNFYVNCHTQL